MADKLHPYPDILTQAYHSAYSDQLPPFEEFANLLLGVEDPEVIENMANYLYKDKFEHLDRAEFDDKTGLNLYRKHQEGPGFIESFMDSFNYSLLKANPMMYGETAEAFGIITDSPQLEKMGKGWQDWAEGLDIGEAPTAELQDIDSVKSFFQWMAQAGGSGIGSTVVPMATGAAGAVAGAAVGGPVGGTIGAILGAGLTSAPLNMGEIYAQLKREGVPKEDAAMASLIWNIPVTALDAIGVERLLKVVPGSASVKKALGQRLGQAVAGMARGAAAEGATEAGQSAIREAVAASLTDNPNVSERLLSILNEAAAGFVTGGGIGGARSAIGRVDEPTPETVEPEDEPLPAPEPTEPTAIPETERSVASLVMEEEAKAGKRTKIDPLQVKVGDRVVVDRPTGQPEEGTVSEASDNLVRVKNDAGSPIGIYVPGVETDISLYEVLPDEEAIAEQAEQEADIAKWNDEAERAIGRIEKNPEDTVSADALNKLRNDKRFAQLPEEQRNRVDDFLLKIRQREEAKEAATDAVAEPVPDTVSTPVPDRAGVAGAGTAGDAVTDAADRVAALEGEDVGTQETETVDEATERAPIDFKPIKTDTVVTSSGQEHQVEYAVVDAAALVTSHDQEGNVNPAYPQQIQPRERGRKASQLQIQRIATGIQPRLLGESPTAESGAPIVDPEGIVESGNARTIALRRAYASGQADEYRAFLEDQGYTTEGIEQPVLVRIRRSDLSEAERQAFTREANQPATLGVSRTEQAFMDADAMPEGVVGQHEGGDLTLARNRPFVQSFIQNVIPKDQQTEFVAKGGELSVEGRQRMEAALIAKAFENRDLVSRLTESVEQGRATIKNAVLDLAPRWAVMREAVSKGELYPIVDQTQALVDAVGIIARNEQTGTAISELLSPGLFPSEQPELVGERGQMMHSILSLLYRDPGKWRRLRAAKDITEALDQYLVDAKRRDPRTADMFEGEKQPDPLALMQRAKETQDGGAQEPGGDGTDTDATETGTAGERSRREGVVDEGRTEPPIATPPQRDDGQDPATFQPIVDELETLIARLAPGVALETPSRARDAQGRFISGKFTPGMRQQIITVASTGNPAATLRHEVIHALRNAGLFSDSEWKALRREAVSKGWLTKYRVKERYPELYDGNTPTDAAIEEAIADAFAEWSLNAQGYSSATARVFARIREFFRRLIHTLRLWEFPVSANSVFENIDAGVVGSRGWLGQHAVAVAGTLSGSRSKYSRAFHASPHTFKSFSTENIGGGEGNQAFGWGLYFAEREAIVEYYKYFFNEKIPGKATALSQEESNVIPRWVLQELQRIDQVFADSETKRVELDNLLREEFENHLWSPEEYSDEQQEIIDALRKIQRSGDYSVSISKAPVYKVTLAPNEDEYLLLDEMLTSQPIGVQRSLLALQREVGGPDVDFQNGDNGADYYRELGNQLGGPMEASRALLRHNIRGNKYLDAASRKGGKDPTYNYVVFDAADVKIDDVRYSRPIDPDAPPVLENEESETRLAAAEQGIQDDTLRQRMGEAWDAMRRNLTRHFPLIDKTPFNVDLLQKMLHLQSQTKSNQDKIANTFRRVLGGLNDGHIRTFTRYLVFRDLLWTADQGMAVGFGLTDVDQIAFELRKLQVRVDSTPILKERYEIRQTELKRLRDEMVQTGVLTEAQAKNPHYFRHQVLAYAKIRQAAGRGEKMSSAYWHSRKGSEKDINANYVQAEAEWMFKAMNDISIMRFLNWLKGSKYDKKPAMVRQAKAANRESLLQAIGTDTEKADIYRGFNQKIAASMAMLTKAVTNASQEALDSVPAELQSQVKRIAGGAGANLDEGAAIFGAVAWFANQSPNVELQNAARGVLGAISRRKKWISTEAIPEQYVDPMSTRDLMKAFGGENESVWQPDAYDGKTRAVHIFTGKPITEQFVDRITDRLPEVWEEVMAGEQLSLTLPLTRAEFKEFVDAVRDQRMIGGPKHEMILEAGIADTLNEFHDREAAKGFDAMLRMVTGRWKQWILFSPRRFLKYSLNNRMGDLDAILANPSATGTLRYIKTAFTELKQFHGDKPPTKLLMEAIDKGVVQSGLTRQEIQSGSEAIMSAGGSEITISALRDAITPVRLAGKYFQSIINASNLMENAVRYAAYIHYRNQIVDQKKTVDQLGYGATPKWVIEGVSDPLDLAAVMARDALGDYGNVSATGTWARNRLIPFVSWMETNTVRYIHLFKNAYLHTRDVNAAEGVAAGMMTAASMFARIGIFYGAVQLWNNLFFGDEEDDLSTEERIRLHLHVGRWGGQINTIRFQGALSDFLGWFGMEDVGSALTEVQRGRASVGDVIQGIAKAPVNRIAQGVTPIYKVPIELGLGRGFFPDVFKPRAIRDPWEHLFRTFSAQHEYAEVAKMLGRAVPTRGYARSLLQLLVYSREPGEMAYDGIRNKAYRFLSKQKGTDVPARTDPRSRALYLYRKSVRFDDARAIALTRELLKENKLFGESLVRSKKRAAPLGMLGSKDRPAFMRTLTTQERDQLKRASKWYRETYWGSSK